MRPETKFFAAGLSLSALLFSAPCRAQSPGISYELQQVLKGGKGVKRLAFGAAGGLAAFGDNITVWSPDSGALLATIESKGRDKAVAISADGTMAAAGDQTIGLWQVPSGVPANTISDASKPLSALAFSPDGSMLASGSDDGTIELWNVKFGKSGGKLTGHDGKILALAFSADGQGLISASEDKTVRLWDVVQRKEKRSISESASKFGDLTAVAISPGGDYFATGLTEVKRDESNFRSRAGPPVWTRMVKIRSGATGEELASFTGHPKDIAAVAVDPTGRVAASGGPDKTVRLWDVGRKAEIATIPQDSAVIALALSPDAEWLAAAGKDGTVSVWKIKGLPAPAVASAAAPKAGEEEPRPKARPALPPSPVLASYKSAERADDFALVIGVESYANLPKADFAERDAASFFSHVEALGVPRRNIILLSGAQAGFTSFKKYLESWLPRNVKPDSRVYFYFSGHGAPDPKTGEAFLVPWDGDPNFLADTAYPVKKLYKSLSALPAAEIFVALDSCFSGAGGRSVLAEGARPLVTKVDIKGPQDPRMTVLTAAASDEITSTLKEASHGIFTYFLLKGLNGEAKDASGHITTQSLFQYLQPHVQDEAHRQNREQTPTSTTGQGIVLRSP
jgi:hypothetical protein